MISVEVAVTEPAWRAALPDVETLVRQAAAALDVLDAQGEAAIVLGDSDLVRDLNARFRGKDTPTNVLSFPAPDNPLRHLGDLALAFEVCHAEARDQAKPLANHLRHLIVHGLLHLLGYDHKDEAEGDAMEALERRVLGSMGVPDPYDEIA